jgi:hypothetical protein
MFVDEAASVAVAVAVKRYLHSTLAPPLTKAAGAYVIKLFTAVSYDFS